MNTNPEPDRWQEIKDMWKKREALQFALAGFFAGILFWAVILAFDENNRGFIQNLGPEAVGIGFTVFIIDRLNRRRDEKREMRLLKERLIRQLGSSINEVAKRAAEELAVPEHGWLKDGTLEKAHLVKANLQQVELWEANLREANLWDADLRNAVLASAKLQDALLPSAKLMGAILHSAHLERAILERASLQKADLKHAKLQGANLKYANLREADLEKADLRGADLEFANLYETHFGWTDFDETTILPDGTHWTLREGNLPRFTDPNHPDF